MSLTKSWLPRIVLLGLAASGLSLAASTPDLPGAMDSGWVMADLNGDHHVDVATARSALRNAAGYSQEVRIQLGSSQQTSFRFDSSSSTVELSSQDVDGDDDGDLVVFEPLSSQPIAVWLNDGAGSFHEGHLDDFRKLWSEHPGPAWHARIEEPSALGISDERTQSITARPAMIAPEPINRASSLPQALSRRDGCRSDFRPRAPPRNS